MDKTESHKFKIIYFISKNVLYKSIKTKKLYIYKPEKGGTNIINKTSVEEGEGQSMLGKWGQTTVTVYRPDTDLIWFNPKGVLVLSLSM